MAPSKKSIPFDFVLEELERLQPYTKPMFGCRSVYVGDQIVLILRQKDTGKADNGVWLATTGEHHASLKKDFPNMRSIEAFGPGPTGWQVLPEDSDDFEESVLKACRFVLNGDPRIGKVPKSRAPKRPKKEEKIGKLRADLIKRLQKIPGVVSRKSKFADIGAIFFKEKEIAHFHHDHEIDVRLTKKVIRKEGLNHPTGSKLHKHRSPTSEWIEIRFKKPADVTEVVRLFKLAVKQY